MMLHEAARGSLPISEATRHTREAVHARKHATIEGALLAAAECVLPVHRDACRCGRAHHQLSRREAINIHPAPRRPAWLAVEAVNIGVKLSKRGESVVVHAGVEDLMRDDGTLEGADEAGAVHVAVDFATNPLRTAGDGWRHDAGEGSRGESEYLRAFARAPVAWRPSERPWASAPPGRVNPSRVRRAAPAAPKTARASGPDSRCSAPSAYGRGPRGRLDALQTPRAPRSRSSQRYGRSASRPTPFAPKTEPQPERQRRLHSRQRSVP
eukprot:4473027-Prymnesium_polylepis.2